MKMKRNIFLTILFSLGGCSLAYAQVNYYFPQQNYMNTYNQPQLTNCYYTQSYPRTYYGNCSGPGFEYTRNYQNYQNYQNSYQNYPYNPYSYSNNNTSLGCNSGGNFNSGYNYNYNNYGTPYGCYYQNNRQICY